MNPTFSILTDSTCGEACWNAREEICRCSCGGANHGCLSHGGTAPDRTSKIAGVAYKLRGVGKYAELYRLAAAINAAAGYRSIEEPTPVETDGRTWFHQYRYTWSETDDGAPARLKPASKAQLATWAELTAFRMTGAYLLWERLEMPARPTTLLVDKETGQPLANQNPPL